LIASESPQPLITIRQPSLFISPIADGKAVFPCSLYLYKYSSRAKVRKEQIGNIVRIKKDILRVFIRREKRDAKWQDALERDNHQNRKKFGVTWTRKMRKNDAEMVLFNSGNV